MPTRRSAPDGHRLFSSIVLMGVGLAGGCATSHDGDGREEAGVAGDAAATTGAAGADAASKPDARATDANILTKDASSVDARLADAHADSATLDAHTGDSGLDCQEYVGMCWCGGGGQSGCPEECAGWFPCIL